MESVTKRSNAKPRSSTKLSRGAQAVRSLKLTEARARLSPLVRAIDGLGEVAISVRGRVRAYLVGSRRFEELRAEALAARRDVERPPIRGTLRLVADLEKGSEKASDRLRGAASGRAS